MVRTEATIIPEATITVEKRIQRNEFETIDTAIFGFHFLYYETPKIKAKATCMLKKHTEYGFAKWERLNETVQGYTPRVWQRYSGCYDYRVRIVWKIVTKADIIRQSTPGTPEFMEYEAQVCRDTLESIWKQNQNPDNPKHYRYLCEIEAIYQRSLDEYTE